MFVWITFFLAQRPESQQRLRVELEAMRESFRATETAPSLQDAPLTDSFVREVLRMKPDSVNTVRMAAKDVEVGQYIIPKGAFCSHYHAEITVD